MRCCHTLSEIMGRSNEESLLRVSLRTCTHSTGCLLQSVGNNAEASGTSLKERRKREKKIACYCKLQIANSSA
jgi:hypothetical protein